MSSNKYYRYNSISLLLWTWEQQNIILQQIAAVKVKRKNTVINSKNLYHIGGASVSEATANDGIDKNKYKDDAALA